MKIYVASSVGLEECMHTGVCATLLGAKRKENVNYIEEWEVGGDKPTNTWHWRCLPHNGTSDCYSLKKSKKCKFVWKSMDEWTEDLRKKFPGMYT